MSRQSPQDQLRDYLEENFNNVVDKGDKYNFDCHCEGVDNKGKGVAYKNNPRFTFCSHEPNNGIPTGIKVPKKDFVPDGFRKEKEASFISHGLDIAKLQKLKVLDLDLNIIDKESPKYLYYDKASGKATWRSIGKTSKKKLKRGTGREIYSIYGKDVPSKLYVFAGEWDMLLAIQDGLHRGTTRCTSPFHGESIRLTKKETIAIFQKHKEIIFCYDNDKAGIDSIIKKIADLPKKLGKKTKVGYVELPFGDGSQGADYCDWRKNHSVDGFRKLDIKSEPPKQKAPKKEEKKETTKKEEYTPKPQFIERDNQTYHLKVDKKKDTSEYVLHANFIMRVSEQRTNDDGKVSYLLWLKNHLGQVKKVEVDQGHVLSNPNKFVACIGDMGFFSLYNLNLGTHTAFISRMFIDHEVINKEITQYIGAYKPGKYLYNNAIVTKDGIQNLDKIIPPKTKISLKMPDDIKSYWKETIEKMRKIYGSETWKVIGFCAASIWSREVSQEYNYFPILKIGGSKGSGKSSLASLITSLFGGRREPSLNPKNVHSTAKSIWRDAEKFNGMPITLNEYKGGNKENQLISQLYDREGYNRSKTTNDLQTHNTTVNATFIVISTREISGYESEAVTSRCVDINLEANPENKKPYDLLKNDKFLSSFPVLALQLDTNKIFNDINGHVSENLDLDTRATENHAIFLSFYTAIMESIGESMDKEELGGKLDETVKEKQITTNRENYAVKFLELIMAEISRNNSDIAYRLAIIESKGLYFRRTSSILSILKNKSTGRDLPNVTTITRELKEMNLVYENSRVFAGDQSKCWFIERSKLIELGIEEPEEVTNSGGENWNKPTDLQ